MISQEKSKKSWKSIIESNFESFSKSQEQLIDDAFEFTI